MMAPRLARRAVARARSLAPFRYPAPPVGVRVLMYHHVRREVLARHLDFLVPRFQILSLSDLLAFLAGRLRLDSPALLFSFDDGYEDHFTQALPELRRRVLPAVFLVVPGLIGSDHIFWWERLNATIEATPRSHLRLAGRSLPLTTPTSRRRAVASAAKWLRCLPEDRIEPALGEIFSVLAAPPVAGPSSRLLTWPMLQELHNAGMTIGSHTLTHPRLTGVPEAEARRQIEVSKCLLEQRLGSEVQCFAYPYGQVGDFDSHTEQLVRVAGYLTALAAVDAPVELGGDRYALPRVAIDIDDPLPVLAAKAYGFWPSLRRYGRPAKRTMERAAELSNRFVRREG
ncbi:MAG: polysaccharide deacetylase family protein [Dehalococcoidia bacterium]